MKPSFTTRDEQAEAALAALRRARIRAIEIARATGTMIIQADGDKVVRIDPNTLSLDDYQAK
jgi:hypothetical protein